MSYASTVLADGAVGYWRLNETSGTTAADSAGSNNGVYQGGFTLAAGALIGQDLTASSVLLDGTTGNIHLPTTTGLPRTPPITVEGIIEITALPPSGGFSHARIASLGHYPDGGWGFGLTSAGEMLMTEFAVADYSTAGGVIAAPGRYHMAVTCDGSNHRFYRNGVLIDTIAMSAFTDPGSSEDGYLGSAFFSGAVSDLYGGKLAEIAVYPTVLTGTQIAAHVAAAAPIGFIGSSTAVISSSTVGSVATNTATLAKPSGVAAGDLIIIDMGGAGKGHVTYDSGPDDPALTPPTGFKTKHYYCGSGNNWLNWLMYRVADGTEGSSFVATVTGTTSDTGSGTMQGAAVCIVLRGADTAQPFAAAVSPDLTEPPGSDPAVNAVWSAYDAISLIAFTSGSTDAITYPGGWSETDGGSATDSGTTMTVHVACNLTPVKGPNLLPGQTMGATNSQYTLGTQYAIRPSGGAHGEVEVVQYAQNVDLTVPTSTATQAGNTLLVAIQVFGQDGPSPAPAITGITGVGSNTMIEDTGSEATMTAGASYGMRTVFYYCEDISAFGPGAIAFTTDIGSFNRMAFWELTPSTRDGGAGNNQVSSPSSPTTLDAGTLTPSREGAFGAYLANEDGSGVDAWAADPIWQKLYESGAGNGGTFTLWTVLLPASAVDFKSTYSESAINWAASGIEFAPPLGVPEVGSSARSVSAATATLTAPNAAAVTASAGSVGAATALLAAGTSAVSRSSSAASAHLASPVSPAPSAVAVSAARVVLAARTLLSAHAGSVSGASAGMVTHQPPQLTYPTTLAQVEPRPTTLVPLEYDTGLRPIFHDSTLAIVDHPTTLTLVLVSVLLPTTTDSLDGGSPDEEFAVAIDGGSP